MKNKENDNDENLNGIYCSFSAYFVAGLLLGILVALRLNIFHNPAR